MSYYTDKELAHYYRRTGSIRIVMELTGVPANRVVLAVSNQRYDTARKDALYRQICEARQPNKKKEEVVEIASRPISSIPKLTRNRPKVRKKKATGEKVVQISKIKEKKKVMEG